MSIILPFSQRNGSWVGIVDPGEEHRVVTWFGVEFVYDMPIACPCSLMAMA
jgi:hypothetical protein